ncbi:bactofilin family protein [Croceicoccus naphthovorans]|uniref:Cell shape determination protein CcmA n=1 Tax=Croceicoccus naphthovorans TaxID=1348774 RepID=A0A0G3XI04_9SPHN|nr:polymer-forming cytoskeletal protein [Croceicoccus naphthovorans]AKM11180.1 cell shape determination protein CcmA [Croceicoccus naphthovorans]MBB3989931.1 cytoskeletal protein CcmA (bactofilin family) [Croceicoccus naphthovorans]
MASGSSFSVLGADIKIKGDISASDDLHIDGSVDGDIDCGSLVQGEQSSITGSITADSARLAGTVEGSINAKTLVVLKSAKITGDVFYDTLTIEQGAAVEGRFAQRAHDSGKKGGESEPVLSLAT